MATKTQANLIKIAANKGDLVLAAKLAILANIEQGSNGVFVHNAFGDVEHVMTRQQWAGCLSQLTQQGFYAPSQDPEHKGHYGYVRVSE